MICLISQRHELNKHGKEIDVLENDYVKYFHSKNITLLPISNAEQNPKQFINRFNVTHIVLSGGNNITPSLYGNKDEQMEGTSLVRDELEVSIIKVALELDIPIFGICRGMQLLNVFFGGTLHQLTKEKINHPPAVPHGIVSNRNILEENKVFQTNSYHNQAVLKGGMAKDLEIVAHAENTEIVEMLTHKMYKVAGVQWHPEREGSCSTLDSHLLDQFISKTGFWK